MQAIAHLHIASIGFGLGDFNGAAIWFFILAMLIFASSIALRSFILFGIQLVLFVGFVLIVTNSGANLALLFLVIQAFLFLYVVYRIQLAVKYNYDLIREKTHLAPRDITTKSYTGTKFTF